MSFKESYPDENSRWWEALELVRTRLVGFVGVVRWACFWTAIAVPFLWAALLVQGISTSGEFLAFSVLMSVNVVTLVVGHGHDPRTNRRQD